MEEQVGALWHRLVSRVADRRYPEAAVSLGRLRTRLAMFYRALGGDGGLQVEAVDAIANPGHRGWLQRLAGNDARIHVACRDQRALRLPPRIAVFAEAGLNRDLYYWLTALAAAAETVSTDAFRAGPSARDACTWNQVLSRDVLLRFSGMRARYRRLVDHHLAQRAAVQAGTPRHRQTEAAIRAALLEPGSVAGTAVSAAEAMTVPLWLRIDDAVQRACDTDRHADNATQHSSDMRDLDELGKRDAERVTESDSERGLVTVRMENIFCMGEFVNVDRGSEAEDDIERAADVAGDLDKLAIARDAGKTTATLRFDLDLPAASADDTIIEEGLLLPEWDWKQARLQPDHCRIVQLVAGDAPPGALPAHLTRVARRLRRQFQALAPARQWLAAQPDGQEIDIDACIRFDCDRRGGHADAGSRLYRALRSGERDLSCLLLADLSLSTDAHIDDRHRVIDVVRDSLFLFGECLSANGDRFALHGFSSRKRDPVRIHRIKGFDEVYGAAVRGRIAAIKPGYYTRLGAAIRFASRRLIEQGSGRRLLLVLTDGKPNDLDQYEGRYGIEDTRHAVMDARRQGLLPFCVTIDTRGNDYLPYLFGRSNYVVIRDPARLPHELPRLYALFSRL